LPDLGRMQKRPLGKGEEYYGTVYSDVVAHDFGEEWEEEEEEGVREEKCGVKPRSRVGKGGRGRGLGKADAP